MKQNIIDHLMRGVSVPTISSGGFSFASGIMTSVLAFFEIYAATIGAVCTVVSLFFMIFFGIANGRKLDKSADNSNRLNIVDQHIEDMSKELNSKLSKIERALKPKGESNEKRNPKN